MSAVAGIGASDDPAARSRSVADDSAVKFREMLRQNANDNWGAAGPDEGSSPRQPSGLPGGRLPGPPPDDRAPKIAWQQNQKLSFPDPPTGRPSTVPGNAPGVSDADRDGPLAGQHYAKDDAPQGRAADRPARQYALVDTQSRGPEGGAQAAPAKNRETGGLITGLCTNDEAFLAARMQQHGASNAQIQNAVDARRATTSSSPGAYLSAYNPHDDQLAAEQRLRQANNLAIAFGGPIMAGLPAAATVAGAPPRVVEQLGEVNVGLASGLVFGSKARIAKTGGAALQGAAPTVGRAVVEQASETIVGAAQGPTVAFRRNQNGEVRTLEQAVAIARKNGVDIPEDIKFHVKSDLPDHKRAEYGQLGPKRENQTVGWSDLVNSFTKKVPVALHPDILSSDEEIVGVLGHEMHELNSLREEFAAWPGGRMPVREFHDLIRPGLTGNLHDEAWDIGSALVRKMREQR